MFTLRAVCWLMTSLAAACAVGTGVEGTPKLVLQAQAGAHWTRPGCGLDQAGDCPTFANVQALLDALAPHVPDELACPGASNVIDPELILSVIGIESSLYNRPEDSPQSKFFHALGIGRDAGQDRQLVRYARNLKSACGAPAYSRSVGA